MKHSKPNWQRSWMPHEQQTNDGVGWHAQNEVMGVAKQPRPSLRSGTCHPAAAAGLDGRGILAGATSTNFHHVEFQALELMRQRGITNASLVHNWERLPLPCPQCAPRLPTGSLSLGRLESSLARGSRLDIFGLAQSPSQAIGNLTGGTWYAVRTRI